MNPIKKSIKKEFNHAKTSIHDVGFFLESPFPILSWFLNLYTHPDPNKK